MKTINHLIALLIRSALIVTIMVPISQAHAAQPIRSSASGAIRNELLSPGGFLNSDGTLRLNDNTSGSLDLSGWDVQIDPERGPVFSVPKAEKPTFPSS